MSPKGLTNPDLQSADWPTPQPRADWLTRWLAQPRLGVLFDLDGTLLDTAADLGGVANRLREDAGLPPLPLEDLRPHASKGARGMIQRALGIEWDDERFEPLRNRFLDIYQEDLSRHTTFMAGLEAVVEDLEARRVSWGIVTNKFQRFTDPLILALGLQARVAVCVSGDTTPHAKPHPEPVRHACKVMGLPAQAVVYVGDDYRDIQSGFNAGCHTIAATFGFCSNDRPVSDWGADAVAQTGHSLINLLRD